MKSIFALILFSVTIHAFGQKADEILARHFKAVGGREKLAAITNTSSEYVMINAGGRKDTTFLVTVQELPNNIHRETYTPDGKFLTYEFYGNNKGTIMIFYKPYPMNTRHEKKSDVVLSQSSVLLATEKKLNRIEDRTIDGVVCYALKSSVKNPLTKASTTYYFDKSSADLFASSTDYVANNMTYYKDWRDVDGVRFPFVEDYFLNGTLITHTEYRSIKTNIPLDSYSFEPEDTRGKPLRDTTSRFNKLEFTDPSYSNTNLQQFATQFRGKTMLVDVWATWCGPCKIEFTRYDDDFYRFLKSNDVEMVFVSIDQPGRKENWQQDVAWFNLNGYHVLAGNKLIDSIEREIFDSKTMYIPRYFLIDSFGKIVTKDLGKPSAKDFREKLAQALSIKP